MIHIGEKINVLGTAHGCFGRFYCYYVCIICTLQEMTCIVMEECVNCEERNVWVFFLPSELCCWGFIYQ